jgi:hypothetical protein
MQVGYEPWTSCAKQCTAPPGFTPQMQDREVETRKHREGISAAMHRKPGRTKTLGYNSVTEEQ